METEIFQELQDANEGRKRRIEQYKAYVETMTKKRMSGIVDELVDFRRKQGKTQQEIAEATGMAPPNIARMESGRVLPSLQALEKYANAIGMELHIELKPKEKKS